VYFAVDIFHYCIDYCNRYGE